MASQRVVSSLDHHITEVGGNMKCKYGHEMPENEFLCSACFSEGRNVTVLSRISDIQRGMTEWLAMEGIMKNEYWVCMKEKVGEKSFRYHPIAKVEEVFKGEKGQYLKVSKGKSFL